MMQGTLHLVQVKCSVSRGVRLPEGPRNPAVRQLVLRVKLQARKTTTSVKSRALTAKYLIRVSSLQLFSK